MADYFLNLGHCVFELLFGDLATHAVHLRLIGKHAVDFLLVITQLFSLSVTAEALRAKIHWKSAFGRG